MQGRIVVTVLATWALTAVAAYAAVDVTGIVKDPSGAAVGEATVTLLTAEQTVIATTKTDASGKFKLQAPSAGSYLLVAKSPTLGESRIPLTVGNHGPPSVEITLQVTALREDVTITVSRSTSSIPKTSPRVSRPSSRKPSKARPASASSRRARPWPACSSAA